MLMLASKMIVSSHVGEIVCPKSQGLAQSEGEVMLEFPYPSEVWEPEGLAFSEGYLWFASQ